MSWFRSNRLDAWCAMVALALQLVAAFGHVHRGGTMRPFAFSYFAATTVHLSTIAPASTSDLPKSTDLGFDYCAVCTAMALAGTPVPPVSPQLPLPGAVIGVQHWSHAEF